jgi:hypothetical protein
MTITWSPCTPWPALAGRVVHDRLLRPR